MWSTMSHNLRPSGHEATKTYSESLESVYSFFQESRKIMRKFPVGRLEPNNQNHLGVLISRVMSDVLRPFLEKWQVNYRHWWENESNPRISPMERQKAFPELSAFLDDWCSVRTLMRALQGKLMETYKLMDVTGQTQQ